MTFFQIKVVTVYDTGFPKLSYDQYIDNITISVVAAFNNRCHSLPVGPGRK